MPAVLHQPITGPIFNRILNSIRFKDKPTIKPPYTRNNLIYEVSYIIIKYITLKVIGLSKVDHNWHFHWHFKGTKRKVLHRADYKMDWMSRDYPFQHTKDGHTRGQF